MMTASSRFTVRWGRIFAASNTDGYARVTQNLHCIILSCAVERGLAPAEINGIKKRREHAIQT